jgi:ATP-dependent RNA helicase DDX51/DBP6
MLIDILIATPGRLAEHILHNPGFTLQHLKFLVLDEADRLFHQSFQNWTDLVIREISSPKTLSNSLSIAEYIQSRDEIPIIGQRYMDFLYGSRSSSTTHVRKLIFSATLTYDIGKLTSLQMSSPETISVHSTVSSEALDNTGDDAIFSLPDTLHEYAVTSTLEKPQMLISLLQTYKLHDKTLIFTHSVETASRLHQFLSHSGNNDIKMALITSQVPLKSRRKLISSFKAGKLNMYDPFRRS